jgi:hypothetical protein
MTLVMISGERSEEEDAEIVSKCRSGLDHATRFDSLVAVSRVLLLRAATDGRGMAKYGSSVPRSHYLKAILSSVALTLEISGCRRQSAGLRC